MPFATAVGGIGYGLLAAVAAAPVPVTPADHAGFRLEQGPAGFADAAGAALRNSRERSAFEQAPDFGTGRYSPPQRSWQAGEHGPVIELGALGSRRADVPGLAHMRIGWDF